MDLDIDPEIDFIEESQENINDELLISIVRENPVLYDKTSKDYKNKELKRDIWESIGETLSCTGEQASASKAEGRWNTLRNTFTKKLREMKAGPPSGSEWKKTKMWVYFKQMSFLTPHIAHRMSRSSIVHSEQEKSNTSQSMMGSSLFKKDSTVKISSPLPPKDISSIVNALTCSDDSTSSYSWNESLSANIATSDQSPSLEQSSVTLTDRENNVSQHVSKVQKKTAADIITMDNTMRTKKVVPAPDRFAAKKQKTTETVENILSQSSHALNVVATAFLHRVTTQQEVQQHPYITAIAVAMKKVPDEQQLTCFMSVMQIISTYSRDK